MMSDERKKYDKEFKQKAVELSYARGSATEIAEELGIRPQMLYRWRRELKRYDKNSFPGNGKPVMPIRTKPLFPFLTGLKVGITGADDIQLWGTKQSKSLRE